jgi:hypothetical protein
MLQRLLKESRCRELDPLDSKLSSEEPEATTNLVSD